MKTKIAFLVHDPIMLAHYGDVWGALGASNFTIITTEHFYFDQDGNERLGLSVFLDHIQTRNYQLVPIKKLISCGIKYKYVVTNHVISGSTPTKTTLSLTNRFKKLINRLLVSFNKSPRWDFEIDINTYLPLQVGFKQIRYMYGADISDGWSLQSWNNIYDIFLCHGVNDEREIKKRFKGEVFVMGYPRYDRFFSGSLDLDKLEQEFNISKSKKTLLWMPTLGGDYSSIPLFAESLSKLNQDFNLIVRPHPFSFVQEKQYIEMLEHFSFQIDRSALRDMNELFSLADVVLTDNGGTPFSAIFLGKNVIFLDVGDSDAHNNTSSAAAAYITGSSVMELKEHLPVIKPQESTVLVELLKSKEFYKGNDEKIDFLYKKYFDSPRGGGADRASKFLVALP